MNWYDGLTLIW